MAETTCEGEWRWFDIEDDLVQQGGLNKDEISINPLTIREHFCAGEYRGDIFTLTWVKDMFMLLSMTKFSAKLVTAFSAVVEYRPFACYENDDYTTVEWDKIDPEKRWGALSGERNLHRLFEGEQ